MNAIGTKIFKNPYTNQYVAPMAIVSSVVMDAN